MRHPETSRGFLKELEQLRNVLWEVDDLVQHYNTSLLIG